MEFDFHSAFNGLFRESYGRIVAALAKEFRDLELAEDALQEALEIAARKWTKSEIPGNAAGWLFVVARRRAIDALRKQTRQQRKARRRAEEELSGQSRRLTMHGFDHPPDERLSLIFACCHPALGDAAQIALTLHTLTGINTSDIAAAFLQKEATVAQRIVRAKRKIREAGIPFVVPDIENSPERLASVLAVIYLIFNTGYVAHSGAELLKADLCDEAVFLADMLVQLIPNNSEIAGLLALLLFQDSRRNARVAADGSPILLEYQNRSLWDAQKIEEGLALLNRWDYLLMGGSYLTQARIASIHAMSATATETRWSEILRHYDRLLEIHPTPIVTLNRAVAVQKTQGAKEALGGSGPSRSGSGTTGISLLSCGSWRVSNGARAKQRSSHGLCACPVAGRK